MKLNRRKKYLQIALNSDLEQASGILRQIPFSDKILIEAGTPLLKSCGAAKAIAAIRSLALPQTYIVADTKCADLADREAELAAEQSDAATVLGVAPLETINLFIEECKKFGLDSMVDMMNVADPLAVLKKLKNPPDAVVLHRGVDESEFSKEKQIPYYQIKQIKGSCKVMVAVAGGDTIREVQRAFFNGADIAVVWKNFYRASDDTAKLAQEFLRETK